MKDKWIVTLEIDTYDGDPKDWAWPIILGGDEGKVIESQFKGRVLPTSEGESK
jgi:hypothetical protein